MTPVSDPSRMTRYARGYLAWLPSLSDRIGADLVPALRDGWRQHQDSHLCLQYDARLPMSVSCQDQYYVLVLGHIVSLADEHEQTDNTDISALLPTQLATKLLAHLLTSTDAFLDALDLCSGRFVCFYQSPDQVGLQVVTDATSMRSVFYCETFAGIISSHPALLAQTLAPVNGIGLDPDVQTFLVQARPRTYNMSHLPGFATRYEAVFQLPSSNVLNLVTNQLPRIFPRKPRQTHTLDEVVNRCSVLFRRTVESFSRNYRTVASLSGGLDSRLTLAACKTSLPDVSFFCYTRAREPVNFVDAVVANQVADRFGLRIHNVTFDYENPPEDAAYKQVLEDLKHNSEFEHFYPLAYAYTTQIPTFDLHLRSNIGEALRAYYHRGAVGVITRGQSSLIEKFAAVYCKENLCERHPYMLEQYERYVRLSGLLEGSLGFDVMTLYELEHSIAVWQSGLLRESDIAFETVCIFNCREVLRLFMSLPFEDWIEGRGMYGCLATLWPELLEIPINPPLSSLPDDAFERFPFIDMDVVRSKTQIKVDVAITNGLLTATASVRDAFATDSNLLEYAFYILKDGARHATIWYSAHRVLTFELDDTLRGAEISVRAFARLANSPEVKVSCTSTTTKFD